jgi:ubiquinone/menaquinone biosynthesis C-methylase UbiE
MSSRLISHSLTINNYTGNYYFKLEKVSYMDDNTLEVLAKQLRKPNGEMGKEVAQRMNKGNLSMNKETIDRLDVKPCDKILEIGMANGFFVKDVLSLADNISYTGCDYSELMVAEAEKLNSAYLEKGLVNFYHASADKLPLPANEFDIIFTVNTIYFWDNPAAILAELNRVLRPGGKLVVTFRPKQHLESNPFTKYGFLTYSNDEIKTFFEENALRIISMEEIQDEKLDIDKNKINTSLIVLTSQK